VSRPLPAKYGRKRIHNPFRNPFDPGDRMPADNPAPANRLATNRLAEETSPYLLQHKDNPVAWQGWGPEAFARAKAEGKPVLLSVGYAACHWCHVMAHESFEDDGIASVMNELFVSIKVDREERPDIDQIYQTALALLGQAGGWPLTMFLTPDGQPFWGGTYFPPEPRYGRPGFADVLRVIAQKYQDDPEAVAQNTLALTDALGQLAAPEAGEGISRAATDQLAGKLYREHDSVQGGIGSAPKFPQVPLLEMLWRSWKRTGVPEHRDAVLLSLTRMSQGGIYDHLGGGFARYSVDAEWLVPHFEKMLYDNAQLIELLIHGWQETGDPLYRQRIAETCDWALADMKAAPGIDGTRAFAASWDADSEGEEGRFYVWSESEIDERLRGDANLFKQIYDVSAGGNWEGKNILNRRHEPTLKDDATEETLAQCREILKAAREAREKPGFDDKVLADWNGMMIAALAQAAAVFGEQRWLTAALSAFAFVCHEMQRDGRLLHSWRDGRARHTAMLDDYATMIRAALALSEATGDDTFLEQAKRWVSVADAHYRDDANGGYFFTADDAESLIVRSKTAIDGATPNGNGTMAGNLARLHYLTGEDRYRERAEAIVRAFAGEVATRGLGMATLINANETLQNGLQVVIVGDPGAAATETLLRAVNAQSLPDRVLQVVPETGALPENHPAQGKQPETRGDAPVPTAFVCRAQTCSLPITDAAGLEAALAYA